MRRSLYAMIASFPLLLLGGVLGSYHILTLSVLCFVLGSLGFLWAGIERAHEEEVAREAELKSQQEKPH